jgi:hypothetical protein
MITSVRQWKPTAVPRLFSRAVSAIRSAGVSAQDERESVKERGFFESYEKMMESQAILVLGLQQKRW